MLMVMMMMVQLALATNSDVPMVNASQHASDVMNTQTVMITVTNQTAVRLFSLL